MRKLFNVVASLLCLGVAEHTARATDKTWEYSVQVSAAVQTAPPRIDLSWPQDDCPTAGSYTIYRKGLAEKSWGKGTSLPASATHYVDTRVKVGQAYEYQIIKKSPDRNSYGYIYSGVDVPMTENRGRLLLVVDNTHARELDKELTRLRQDLVGDGWAVTRLDVSRDDSVTSVKALIKAQYDADPQNVKAVFLFGHVPVPYSGDIVPDGHAPDHEGAWPSDGYYGDMTGVWTDKSVNDTRALDPRNRNVPGDGKFDQSNFPAELKLMVGRVDLSNLPGRLSLGGTPTFPGELELLRRYLDKDHNFRTGQFDLPRRAVIGDYFGNRDGEAFAASGWRNFATFFGASNITTMPNEGTWIPNLRTNAYLWAYGCGAGSFTSIAGLGNSDSFHDGLTTELVSNDVKAAFTFLFGSWLADWDSEDDIMRSVLALPGYGLTCACSGRPHWFLQHMALGETIGFGTRLTQNNGPEGLYQNQLNSCAGQIHIALMGDPTLRMHPVAPPSDVNCSRENGNATLTWSGSKDNVVGYHVYRSTQLDGPFTRLTTTPVACNSFTDSNASTGANYMVRAVKLETSASGTYFNPSEGAFLNAFGADASSIAASGATKPVSKPQTPTGMTNRPSMLPATATGNTVTNAVVWFDDKVPAGAQADTTGGDSWNWVSSNPSPFSGAVAHQSGILSGIHQQFFTGASATMNVGTGDILFTAVYLDPANPPSEIMLQWNDGSGWEHRAYWGANNTYWGNDNTVSRRYMGPLPAAGQWALLQIPASQVGLEGVHVSGIAFTMLGGRVTWDYTGDATISAAPTTNPTSNTTSNSTTTSVTGGTATVMIDDALPASAQAGSDGGDNWNWVTSPAPFSGAKAWQSSIQGGEHQVFFSATPQPLSVSSGDTLFAYVYLDPANPPSEVMLQWNDGSAWEHRAYWGANNIYWGSDGTVSRQSMGALPATGQWVALQVPASQVGLAGVNVSGMAFTLYGGRAAWDYAGKSSPSTVITNPPSTGGTTNVTSGGTTNTNSGSTTNTTSTGNNNTNTTTTSGGYGTNIQTVSAIDYTTLELPKVGDNTLHVLTPTLLELKLINSKQPDPAQVTSWNFVNSGQFTPPSSSSLNVTVNGKQVGIASIGFKRRPLFAPWEEYDLRLENSLYVQLTSAVSDGQTVTVQNPDGSLWSSSMTFSTTVDPLRYSPAIHVNQEGYLPNSTKQAMVGFYAGNLGEMPIASGAGFTLVDAATGKQVYQGSLVARQDVGYTYTPTPYQQVYQADFTAFTTPGEYRLVVPGMGGSLPFLINDGVAMSFTRAYALGLYHQRCGTATAMPYTRWIHDVCHHAPAAVPTSSSTYPFTWTTIANYANIVNSDNPVQTAPRLTGPSAQLFPYVNQGPVDVSGGHHDAGDYSKYTANSANLVHLLMFAVDSLPGVASLDNLGIPESGDGISDVLQEAKWEADFLAKMQDTDGGFYFLVYPQNREYESGVTPDHGDPQVVWPKTTSVTAGSVAALAQCASSSAFKAAYPAAAAAYLQKAKLGWQFLMNAINKYGKTGAYQKITHYGDDYADQDELAWAACQMFLATGDQSIHQMLLSWFDPSNPGTWRWGWWHMNECYGHCIRSYAFAAQSGRIAASALDPTFLSKCQAEIATAANNAMNWSQQSAYGTSFPQPSKAVQTAGWYFSAAQAFDIAVAYQLNPSPAYMNAMLANVNYEGGCNPVNVCYITGMGWKRQRDIVSQWASADNLVMPPSGIPVGNVEATFPYNSTYNALLESVCFPSDGASTAPYPFYDRWGDSWNVTAEMTIQDQARGFGTVAFLAAQTSYKTQPWKSVAGTIKVPSGTVSGDSPVTLTMSAPGVDLTGARIAWEVSGQEPTFGQSFTYTPGSAGLQSAQAEAELPDGRRVYAIASFNTTSTNSLWVDDSLPQGATGNVDGGDSWTWVSSSPTPNTGSLAHQSAIASGEHQHYFLNATASMAVNTGDILYTYIYIDPNNIPSEVMLQWYDGSGWEHRAYWGANNIYYGTDGTVGRHYMGGVPAAGQWVKLSVPASQVGLEGKTVTGMAFTLYGGRATWDTSGCASGPAGTTAANISVGGAVDASRAAMDPGAFTITRSGDTTAALTVPYSLSGTAASGSDYISSGSGLSPPTLSIPAGATSATLSIAPLPATNIVGNETVVLTLLTNTGYTLGNPNSASLSLAGNTVRPFSFHMTPTGASLAWPSLSNAIYQIAYKNNLTDAAWTSVSGNINASGLTTSWTDPTATTANQRFYVITRVQ